MRFQDISDTIHPNHAGKDMTCLYDNVHSKDFRSATAAMMQCQGSYYEAAFGNGQSGG